MARTDTEKRREQLRQASKRYYTRNRKARIEQSRQWRKKNPERAREKDRQWSLTYKDRRRSIDLLRKYGITTEDYDLILKEQDGRCPICGADEPGRWHVDHCHETGKVRGILCIQCNTTLGRIEKYPHRFQRMVDYINLHKESIQ